MILRSRTWGGAPVRTTVRVLALLMVMFAMTAGVAGGAKQRVHEVKYRRYPARQASDYRNNPQQYSKWQIYASGSRPCSWYGARTTRSSLWRVPRFTDAMCRKRKSTCSTVGTSYSKNVPRP